jgi:hypothetical protein
MRRWLGILGLAFSVGCATTVVRHYVGEQQNWPTGRGGIVSTGFSIPVFPSLPPRPYDIIAELRVDRPNTAQAGQEDLPSLVKKAKAMGADALMFVDPRTFFAYDYGARTDGATPAARPLAVTDANQFNSDSFQPGATFLAIKWVKLPPAIKPTPEVPVAPAAAPAVEPTPAMNAPTAEVPLAEQPPATNAPADPMPTPGPANP